MLNSLFLSIVERSLAVCGLIACVLMLRAVFRKAPRRMLLLLWLPVVFRLLSPITAKSRFSLIPASLSASVSAYFQGGENTQTDKTATETKEARQPEQGQTPDSSNSPTAENRNPDNSGTNQMVSDNTQTAPSVGNSTSDDNTQTAPSVGNHQMVSDNTQIAPSVGNSTSDDNTQTAPSVGNHQMVSDNTQTMPSVGNLISDNLTSDNTQTAPSIGNLISDNTTSDNTQTMPSVGNLTSDGTLTAEPAPDTPLSQTDKPSGLNAWFLNYASLLWLAGVIALSSYVFFELLRLRRLTKDTRVQEIGGTPVYFGAHIPAPFLCGLLTPRIYLPEGIAPEHLSAVLAHETMHKTGKDNLLKPFAFLIAAIYWFHPLVWISYAIFCKDLELACDERVLSGLDTDGRKKYLQALLSISTMPHLKGDYPVAFGTTGVTGRIRHAVSFRKPKKSMTALCVLLCVLLTACFSTNPNTAGNTPTPDTNPSATHTGQPTTPPTEGTQDLASFLDPNDAAALRNPLQKETSLLVSVQKNQENPSTPLLLLAWDFGTIARPLTGDSYTSATVGSYLIKELGAVSENHGYRINLTAEQETLSRDETTGMLKMTYSCIKETPDYSFRVVWENEYREEYGWFLTSCTVYPSAKNRPLPLVNSEPFEFTKSEEASYSLYTGSLANAPERFRVPATDLDDDGAPDFVSRKLTYTGNPERPYKASLTVHFASGEILPLVEDDNTEVLSVNVCDFTGNKSSDLLFSLSGTSTGGSYGRHFLFTRNEHGEWKSMPNLSSLRLLISPVSDREYIYRAEDTVWGPFDIADSYLYQKEDIKDMNVWLSQKFFRKSGDNYYYDIVPESVTVSKEKQTENPAQTVLRLHGYTSDSYKLYDSGISADWYIYFTDGSWKVLDVTDTTYYPQYSANTTQLSEKDILTAFQALPDVDAGGYTVATQKTDGTITVAVLAKLWSFSNTETDVISFTSENRKTTGAMPWILKIDNKTRHAELLSCYTSENYLTQLALLSGTDGIYLVKNRNIAYGPNEFDIAYGPDEHVFWETCAAEFWRITADKTEELQLDLEGEDRFSFWENRKAELTEDGYLVLSVRDTDETMFETLLSDRTITGNTYYDSGTYYNYFYYNSLAENQTVPEPSYRKYSYHWMAEQRISLHELCSGHLLTTLKSDSLFSQPAAQILNFLYSPIDGRGYGSSVKYNLYDHTNHGCVLAQKTLMGDTEVVLVKSIDEQQQGGQHIDLLYRNKGERQFRHVYHASGDYALGTISSENGNLYLNCTWHGEAQGLSWGGDGKYLLTPDGVTEQ